MNKYTDEMIEFLREVTPGKTYKETTELFNRKFDLEITVKKMKNLLSRKKIYTETGGCLYKKGCIPWNKGTKGLTKANKTSFKKGERPKSWKPVGSERIDRDGYTLIKISNEGGMWQRWALKHRVVWEKHYKMKVPKGSVIIFADGNKSNLSVDNLICVTRNELRVLNQCRLIRSVPELTKTGLNIAKIRIKLAEIRKERK